MPSKNLTIDNVNPLIDYQPAGTWSEGNTSDPYYSRYSNGGTFTLSVASGATATFNFNGTAVYLFGAKRGNHGLYNVTLDGTTTTSNGEYPDPGLFQTPLFSAENLSNTLHTVTLTNAGTNSNRALDFLDLDFITWTSEYGTEDEKAQEDTIQDTDSRFLYTPPTAWNTNPQFLSSFFGQSGHATTTSGASTTLTFTGDTVAIFGTVGPQVSPYTVQLDGGPTTTHNATKYADYQQVLLFYADNLGPGSHNVKLTNQPALSGESLNINYALVDAVPSVNATTSSHKFGLSGGAIAGIVIGVLALLAILGVIIFGLRRKRSRMEQTYSPEKPLVFEPFARPEPEIEPTMASVGFPTSSQPHSSTNPPSSPPTSSSGYQGHYNPQPALVGVHNPELGSDAAITLQPQVQANTNAARPLPVPNKASVFANERPQDAGHVPTDGEMPPPDYSQATGPSRG